MTMAFDSLGFVRRLEEAGVERRQAEAHADVARDFILAGVATKADVAAVSKDLERLGERLGERIEQKMENLEQRMTIKLGGFLVVAVGAIVALERLLA